MFKGEELQRCNTDVKIADKFTGEIKKSSQDWKRFNKKFRYSALMKERKEMKDEEESVSSF
jgi:hypothetical protein